MKDTLKAWIRPLSLIILLSLILLAQFDFTKEIPGPMWGLIMLVFGFYFGERGAGNVLNQYRKSE